ncbi:hypothetical protein GCM10010182_38900 [Actinomadura cremea]|nr:hypothetical protein GCM10010182_38900 [Actinomadura cremea]
MPRLLLRAYVRPMTETNGTTWALVLGPGGPVGTAWLLGLAAGLRRHGTDPAAGLIVGTSAGAIAGAMIAAGHDLDTWADLPPRTVAGGGTTGSGLAAAMRRVFEVLGDASLDRGEARRRVGRIAPDAESLRAFGDDPGDMSRWGGCFRAGLRQAPEAAGRIRAALRG